MLTSIRCATSTMLFAAACGGTAGVQTHSTSAVRIEVAGARDESLHEATTREARERCAAAPGAGAPCWTWMTSPTAAQLQDVETRRQAAADHRAGSQALRDAEARSCVGIDEIDRAVSPLMQREDILAVTPLLSAVASAQTAHPPMVGATIEVRAVRRLTAEWLQRALECHAARAAALGHDEEMPSCPLSPMGVQVHVRPMADGFAIDLRGPDAADIFLRAQALIATPSQSWSSVKTRSARMPRGSNG